MGWRALRWPRRWLAGRAPGSGRRERAMSDGSGTERLVADIETFLSGRYLAELRERGEPVPDWAWLNPLAHGDVGELEQLRHAEVLAIRPRRSWPEQAWRTAQRLLARDLLQIVGDDADALRCVQHTVLVPFELELMERRSIDGLSALELVQSIRAVLHAAIW